YPGVTPSISANGSTNGLLWVAENSNPAVLHAYDPANLSTEFYNSNQAASGRDQFGAGNKFMVPTIANGQVFVGTTNSVAAFGLLHAGPLQSGTYTITNQFSGMVLDDPAFSSSSQTRIIQWPLNGGSNQKWEFSANASGYYTIRNHSSGLYLGDPGASQSNGTGLEQLTGDGTDSQLWSLTTAGSGYVIHNKASGLVIDDPAFSQNRGTGIILWGPNGGTNQSWLIN
ncbi:MAG: RICIN domain-containing protein, partial [Acidobacteriaceae bacterium]|nr:RICIN domain-containing protein [Acidobacteriaceae bacterium]